MSTDPQGPLIPRLVWLTVGIVALGLGIVGAVLPLLPTTPLVLLAAFAFMKSSQRLHDWLINHRFFGPLIVEWREYGAISRPAKITALVSMVAIFGISVALQAPHWVLALQAPILFVCGWFIASRPLPPK